MTQITLPELYAMQEIANIVDGLAPTERKRVTVWLAEYAAENALTTNETPQQAPQATFEPTAPVTCEPASGEPADTSPEKAYITFAEFYKATNPKKGAQKAVIAGWWLESQGQTSWKGLRSQ